METKYLVQTRENTSILTESELQEFGAQLAVDWDCEIDDVVGPLGIDVDVIERIIGNIAVTEDGYWHAKTGEFLRERK